MLMNKITEILNHSSTNKALFCFLILTFIAGCGTKTYEPPNLGGLYNTAAMHASGRNPVIVIPGFLGSKLKDSESGQVVWGAFTRDTADPEEPEGARLIALPMRKGAKFSELTDSVHSDGALDVVKVKLFGLPLELNAYINILSTLGAGGYIDEALASNDLNNIDYGDDHFTCFQFDYDWRLDIVENSKRLKKFIEDKTAYIKQEYEKRGIERDEIKFDIVAHSMGGLVARYFVRYGSESLPEDGSLPELTWDGANYIDKLVIVGTPNAGAYGAIETVVIGRDFGPFLPKYESAIIATFPSMPQQFPRSRHGAILDSEGNRLDPLDPDVWIKYQWGLADPEQEEIISWLLPDIDDPNERKEIALDHLRKSLKNARQFQEALDVKASPPPGLKIYLIAGDAILTGSVITVNSNGDIEVTEEALGDGTVLRSSALMDERVGNEWRPLLDSPISWSNVMFLFNDHLGLTKDPTFSDNVLYILLEQPG